MTTINVANLTELYDALASAKGGETIALAGGNYGNLDLNNEYKFGISYPSSVTITSADIDNPAVFTGMDVRGAENLTFDGLTFDYTYQASDNIYDHQFKISDGENVVVRNSTFDGDLAQGRSAVDDGYGFAIALSVRNSEGVKIENNEFFDFHRGLMVDKSNNVEVTGNDLHSLRMDGMNFSTATNVLIEGNYIHDFNGSLNSDDHSDMIQFWTDGTVDPSSNIVIRGNHLDIGAGTPTQSIFMRNELVDRGLAGEELFYQNVLIEENVVVNAHIHGITVGESNGLTIQNNTVLHADGALADGLDDVVELPGINVSENSRNVTVQNNATNDITGFEAQSDWSLRNNAFVQDQYASEPGFYGDVFLSSSLSMTEGVHHFRALPGGMLDTLNAGASLTTDAFEADGVTAQFHVTDTQDNASMRTFDAAFSTGELGALPEGTTFTWNFGDGTTHVGQKVTHAFADGGNYEVSLTVEQPDGATDTRQVDVKVQGPNLFSYNVADGALALEDNAPVALSLGNADTSSGLNLGGNGSAAQVAHIYVAELLEQDEFSIDFTLAAETPGALGEVMRMHGSFMTSVTPAGELFLMVWQEDDYIRLTTDGAKINDTQPHDINIALEDGTLSITVDGQTLASTQMSGALVQFGQRDLIFGNPWGADNFDGTLSTLDINVNASQFTEASSIHHDASATGGLQTHYAPLYDSEGELSTAQSEAQTTQVEALNDTPIDLAKSGVAARVARDDVDEILGEDAFAISMTLTADSAQSTGEVARLHQSFAMYVTQEGEAALWISAEDGSNIYVKTQGAQLNDTAAHDVVISYANDTVKIDVDGTTLASAEMPSPLADKGSNDLTFGNPWGEGNFEGTVAGFDIETPASAARAAPPTSETDNPFASSTIFSNEHVPSDAALATVKLWAERGHITDEMLDRFESMLSNTQDNYFE